LARDQAQYVSAKADLDRAISLADKGFASHQTIEQREALVSGFAGAVKIDQAALDNARLNLDFTTIRAPIAGRIGKRLVDAGNLVHGSDNTVLAEIVQTRPISVLFTVPQSVLPEMRAQMQQGPLSVEAISTDDRHPLSRGTLALIGNQVDPQTGTIELKAAFDNDDDLLWPGQLIEARLTLQTRQNVVAVPVSAVSPTADGKVVFVVGQDHKLSVRKVTLGPSSEGRILIESGLQAGESVAIEKLDELAPGLIIDPQSTAPAEGTPS
jgi:multidrug efflux system membrane fusion protein